MTEHIMYPQPPLMPEQIETGKDVEIRRLTNENERLSELLWGARCVYCGEVVGKDKQNQDVADEVLRNHVQDCPKHPIAELKGDAARFRWLTTDDESKEARILRRELLDRMTVMTYIAACVDIDHAMEQYPLTLEN